MFVSLATEGDYAAEILNRTFYSFPGLPPDGITPLQFWGGLLTPVAHMIVTREEE